MIKPLKSVRKSRKKCLRDSASIFRTKDQIYLELGLELPSPERKRMLLLSERYPCASGRTTDMIIEALIESQFQTVSIMMSSEIHKDAIRRDVLAMCFVLCQDAANLFFDHDSRSPGRSGGMVLYDHACFERFYDRPDGQLHYFCLLSERVLSIH